MGRFVFRMPDIGEGVAEAEIVAWHVCPGARLEEDQPMVDVMTDKATVEMTAPVAGVVLECRGAVGERVAVGGELVVLEVEGEQAFAPAPMAEVVAPVVPVASAGVLAAPATRARARELGIDLAQVHGSGPGGRILLEDLQAETGVQEERITGLRRVIAERLEAAARIPQFSYVEEIDMTALEALRRALNAARAPDAPKLTLLPFLVRGLAAVLPAFPAFNARYDAAAGILRRYTALHVGIATQTPSGLMVPVLRDAQALDVWGIAREIARLAEAARAGTATRDELSGSTITLTSLGVLGGIAATPLLNVPEVAILGPNRLAERAVVREGQVVVRAMMNLSASFDHRIIDGFEAARFIQALRAWLESAPA